MALVLENHEGIKPGTLFATVEKISNKQRQQHSLCLHFPADKTKW